MLDTSTPVFTYLPKLKQNVLEVTYLTVKGTTLPHWTDTLHVALLPPCFYMLSWLFFLRGLWTTSAIVCKVCSFAVSLSLPPSFWSNFSFIWITSVSSGGWLGNGGEGDRSDTASSCGCYLCKASTDVLCCCLPMSFLFNKCSSHWKTRAKFCTSPSFLLIGSQSRGRGARGPGGTWGGIHHPFWWLLWSSSHKD